jgi:nitrilase
MSSGKPFVVAAVQAAPVFLDREATILKTIDLIRQAAEQGARLIAFPECWVPGYPWWVWLDSPAWGMQFVAKYHQEAMSASGPDVARIAAAAQSHNINVVLGFTEKAGGSLYIAQLLVSDEGQIIASRRKLKATHVERTVFGEGDGSDLKVHRTSIGNLGALCCWEHLSPLNKYALFAQNEEIHVGAWPSFSLYEGGAHALSAEVNTSVSQVYAVEGQCFVIAPCALVSPEMQDLLCDTEMKRQLLQLGGGAARIFGPDGKSLAAPLAPNAEGLLLATLDMQQIALAKAAADPVGHYSRPDVLRLLFNPEPQRRVQRFATGFETSALDEAEPALYRPMDEVSQ